MALGAPARNHNSALRIKRFPGRKGETLSNDNRLVFRMQQQKSFSYLQAMIFVTIPPLTALMVYLIVFVSKD